MNKFSLKNSLLALGFTVNDLEVYLALAEIGATPVGALISRTQLHRNIVYTALDHLVARKLVSEQVIRGKKQFALVSPEILTEEFVHKAELAAQVARELEQKLSFALPEITVHQGNEEYLTLLTSIIKTMPKGSTKYVIGTGGEAFMQETMRPIWKAYHKIALTQGIKIKLLSYESHRAAIEKDIKSLSLYEVRYLPNNIENPGGIHVYPEAETILNIIYSNEHTPVTAIKIKNISLVRGYLNLFDNLWKMGKS